MMYTEEKGIKLTYTPTTKLQKILNITYIYESENEIEREMAFDICFL